MAAEELVQRLRVDLEGRVLADVAVDDLEDLGRDVLRLVPVLLVPLLQLRDLAAALHLDVQLDVLRQAGTGEVATNRPAPERRSTSSLRVGDVRLGVELVLACRRGTRSGRSSAPRRSRGTPCEKRRLQLLLLEAVVEAASARSLIALAGMLPWCACVTSAPIRIRILSSCCHLPVELEQRADLEVTRSRCRSSSRSRSTLRGTRTPVQPETLLSTMNSSPRCESEPGLEVCRRSSEMRIIGRWKSSSLRSSGRMEASR